MKYPPSRMRGLRKMQTLREGEDSRTYRVRAPDAVHTWWSSFTAEQRGELLARVMAAEGPAGAGVGQSTPVVPEAPSRPADALAGVAVLRVVSPTVPQRLRNELRWAPKRYADLEDKLSRTATLTLDRVNGKAIWRTSEGKPIRPETVSRLFEADVLTPADDQGERLPKPQPMGLAEAVRQAQRSRK